MTKKREDRSRNIGLNYRVCMLTLLSGPRDVFRIWYPPTIKRSQYSESVIDQQNEMRLLLWIERTPFGRSGSLIPLAICKGLALL